MFREISEEVRVNVKDRLREVRQTVRRRRHDNDPGQRAPFPLSEIEGLLGRAMSAFDDAMTMAETLVPRSYVGGPATIATPRPLGCYFNARDPLTGERAFRRDLYALVKAVLAARRIEGVRVRETRFSAVHAAVARDEANALARVGREASWSERVALVAGISSTLLVELARHDPLHRSENPPGERSLAITCLAPVALACGLASMETNGRPQADLLEIAMLAVDARLERIQDAIDGRQPRADLTVVLATLLAHLP